MAEQVNPVGVKVETKPTRSWRLRPSHDETVPPAVQLAAAGMILDRGYGKPTQQIEASDQGATLEQMLTAIWEARHAAATQERAEGDLEG
jgi:hypothetical protein